VIVRDETELRNAINNAPTKKPTTITLDNDITLTKTINDQSSNYYPANIIIPTDKDITITSNKSNGYYKLNSATNGATLFIASNAILRIDGITVTHTGFTIGSGEDDVTHTINTTGSGVHVDTSATFYFYNGLISGNTAHILSSVPNPGGGVSNKGTFVMSGGEISGNTATNGGGVNNCGTFIMNGGKISDNIATTGGGVGGVGNSFFGVFTMSGGTISSNTAEYGGGVYISYSEFIMSGGTISSNKATQHGGGVYVGTGVIMTDEGYIGTTFTMSGGKISGNTATLGGGVYDSWGGLVRQGGVISGNTATNTGNDVYLEGSGNGLPDGNDGSSNGNNNNSSSDNNNSGESNGNNETTNSNGGFSLKDIVITCVITIVATLCIVLFVLLVSSQKRLRQIEKKQSNL